MPKCPKTAEKKHILVVWDYFSYRNGPIDLVRGLFSSYGIETYIPTTCRPLYTFLGPFRGAQMTQDSIKKYFLVVSDYFSYKNGPIDLVRGLFSSLDIETNNLLTCRLLCTFKGSFVVAQMPQNSIKKLFSGCFGLFLLQEWVY
jgi:hypothetical protein